MSKTKKVLVTLLALLMLLPLSACSQGPAEVKSSGEVSADGTVPPVTLRFYLAGPD